MLRYTLREHFLSLLEQHVHGLRIRGSRATGLCPFHPDKNPSFSVELDKGVFHCFGCSASGGVRDFAYLLGEEWGSPRRETPVSRAQHIALQVARDAYEAWSRHKLIELTDEHRELLAERDIAEIAYRAIHRCPALYKEEEARWWIAKLAAIYDRLAPLDRDLDIHTYSEYEKTRFRWWQEETQILPLKKGQQHD